jgi:hypothetical protein
MVKQYAFPCLRSIISIFGRAVKFLAVVMAVDRGDAIGVLGLFQILMCYSQYYYNVLYISYVKIIVSSCGCNARWLKM